jgi:hypothetical protein
MVSASVTCVDTTAALDYSGKNQQLVKLLSRNMSGGTEENCTNTLFKYFGYET